MNNQPLGIRNDAGFLFYFPAVDKFPDQEDRFRSESEEQRKLADFLLASLQEAEFFDELPTTKGEDIK